jgi:hypothetical protein
MKPTLKEMTCAEAGKLGGHTGGKSTSPAKVEAARKNAKKGGRPRGAASKRRAIKRQLRGAGVRIPETIKYDLQALRTIRADQ